MQKRTHINFIIDTKSLIIFSWTSFKMLYFSLQNWNFTHLFSSFKYIKVILFTETYFLEKYFKIIFKLYIYISIYIHYYHTIWLNNTRQLRSWPQYSIGRDIREWETYKIFKNIITQNSHNFDNEVSQLTDWQTYKIF